MRFKDISGQRFDKLQVLWPVGRDRHSKIVWASQCDCGEIVYVSASSLRTRNTTKCFPCGRREGVVIHGMYATSEYRLYLAAQQRCRSKHPAHRKSYLDRGITFKFISFQDFFACLGNRPSPKHTIDRINNDGHYEAGNVRWATRSQQQRNRRPFSQWSKSCA